ncbi:MAG TPA: hypothetical protein VMW47_06645 [Verrucomicrobiae bacterium]|nr:hypothetical protein [Verrucomicrobiae bacterium]
MVTPRCAGFWLLTRNGFVYPYGRIQTHGSPGASGLHVDDAVGLAAAPDDRGYWVLLGSGRVLAYGSARNYGQPSARRLHETTAAALTPTPSGRGYWVLLANGRVLSFGDAARLGGVPITRGSSDRAVALAVDDTGRGYWIATRNGNVFPRGDAPVVGSPVNLGYHGHGVDAIVSDWPGDGYWELTRGGRVYSFGSAPDDGAPVYDARLAGSPSVALSGGWNTGGYWVMNASGMASLYWFGQCPEDGICPVIPPRHPVPAGVVDIAAADGPPLQTCPPGRLSIAVSSTPPIARDMLDLTVVDTSASECVMSSAPFSLSGTLANGQAYAIPGSWMDQETVVMAPQGDNPGTAADEVLMVSVDYVPESVTGAPCPAATATLRLSIGHGPAVVLRGLALPICPAAFPDARLWFATGATVGG